MTMSCHFNQEDFFSTGCEKYKRVRDKRLANIIARHVVMSHGRCAALCHDNNSCYAVNVIETNQQMVCELSTGFSSEKEMIDDVTSFLFVLGKLTVYYHNIQDTIRETMFASLIHWKR